MGKTAESKRALERRTDQGKGIRMQERGTHQAERWAKAAGRLRHVREAKDGVDGGRVRSAYRLAGDKPHCMRIPSLQVHEQTVTKIGNTKHKRRSARVTVLWHTNHSDMATVDRYELSCASNEPWPSDDEECRIIYSGTLHYYQDWFAEGYHLLRVRAVNHSGNGEWSATQRLEVEPVLFVNMDGKTVSQAEEDAAEALRKRMHMAARERAIVTLKVSNCRAGCLGVSRAFSADFSMSPVHKVSTD
jgi:hypothetical protein